MGVKFLTYRHANIRFLSRNCKEDFKLDPDADFFESVCEAFSYEAGLRFKPYTKVECMGKTVDIESIIDEIIAENVSNSVQYARLAVKLILLLPEWCLKN